MSRGDLATRVWPPDCWADNFFDYSADFDQLVAGLLLPEFGFRLKRHGSPNVWGSYFRQLKLNPFPASQVRLFLCCCGADRQRQ